ncbi:MAG: alpha/beta fold hydrolase [Isosphaeraceae bacterium]
MKTPKAKPESKPFFPLNLLRSYRKHEPLILVNGLAEQSYSWFANRGSWHRHFDLKVPELLVYDGDSLHRHIDGGGEVTVDYLTDRLETFLDEYAQNPPYHLVGSSLGGQVLLKYASRHPGKVRRLVLIAPSGLHGDENLPVMEGVRRSQYDMLVKSVFQKAHFATDELVEAIAEKFQDRKWKKGVLRTLRGTVGHSVADLLDRVKNPTLIIWGANDRIISDVAGSIRAADRMAHVRQVVIPKCGHAPQIEKAGLVNKLVLHFLRDTLRSIPPALEPARLLNPPKRPPFWPAGKP